MKVKLAICQMDVVDNKAKNLKNAEEMVKNAKNGGAEIAVLPEMFICPYENEKFLKYSESEDNSLTLNFISFLAKENNIYILAGSIPEKDGGKIYNTSFFFDDKGEIIGKHRKLHLFDVDVEGEIFFKESGTLSAGDEITVVNTKFGKIGIAICFDIRFPEISMKMALNGAKILIFPGAFNLTTGPPHWELLFRCRGLDNQVFTIGVSPAFNELNSYHAYGHSIICNPWGSVVNQLGYDEELKIVEIDLDDVNKIRNEIPVLKNRRKDLY